MLFVWSLLVPQLPSINITLCLIRTIGNIIHLVIMRFIITVSFMEPSQLSVNVKSSYDVGHIFPYESEPLYV
jgi:hypothetical protein